MRKDADQVQDHSGTDSGMAPVERFGVEHRTVAQLVATDQQAEDAAGRVRGATSFEASDFVSIFWAVTRTDSGYQLRIMTKPRKEINNIERDTMRSMESQFKYI